jgi:hypothetical protein
VETITSRDGTMIAFDRAGSGALLIWLTASSSTAHGC